MVRIEDLRLEFDQPQNVYLAGQILRGNIIIVLKEEKKINEVLLEFKGKATTYWTKHRGNSRKHCSDSEAYFCEQLNTKFTHAFGTSHERVIPPGSHKVAFEFQLPATIPSSFEGEFGYIRYTCKAILERPWDFDIVVREAFTVVGIEDLNEDTKSRDPIRLEESSFDVKFCCRSQGNICISLTLPKSAYVPGETLPIWAQVDNHSSKALKYTCARIKQHVSYRAKTFQGVEVVKEVTREIVKKDKGGLAAGTSEKWDHERLPLPAMPPKLVRCRIIDISYTLEFEVDPGIVVMTPLSVGTVPLIDQVPPSELPHPITSITDIYPSIMQPTFHDDFWGPVDLSNDKDTVHFGKSKFTPKYACYTHLSND